MTLGCNLSCLSCLSSAGLPLLIIGCDQAYKTMKNAIFARTLTRAATFLAAIGLSASASAQSADALINKLVEKGILTVKEADDLREEADHDFKTSYKAESGMPDWLTALRFEGELRGRFEGFYSDNSEFTDRNRFRYRARFGVKALFQNNFEVGLRLTSSERAGNFGGDPISGNATFQDNAAYKHVYLDRVYAKWTPIDGPLWSASGTFGKMANPFSFVNIGLGDAVFDPDYSPEGLSQQFTYEMNPSHTLNLNLGQFILDEVGGSSNDSFLLGAQVRSESKWSPKVRTSMGFTALAIAGDDALLTEPSHSPYNGVPNINRGNTRTPIPPAGTNPGYGGALATHFNPVVLDAGITYTLDSAPFYSGPFPITAGGLFMHNPAASRKNDGYQLGIMVGKSGKKGLWDVSYRYKSLEADVWYEELVDSDFGAFYEGGLAGSGFGAGYGAGTNVRGHIIRANYSPYDALTLGLTYFLTELVDPVHGQSESDMGRVQIDAVWKF